MASQLLRCAVVGSALAAAAAVPDEVSDGRALQTTPKYDVSGQTILRDGLPWTPVGINAMSCFGKTKSPSSYPPNVAIVREWVMMNRQPLNCYPSGCWARKISTGSWLHPLEALLDRNAEEGKVTIVSMHKWDETTDLWAKVPSQTGFWEEYKAKLVNEYIPFLMNYEEAWLSIWNEPFMWDGSDCTGDCDPAQQWYDEMKLIMTEVRTAGYTGVVMVPAGEMGQDESPLLSGHAETLASEFGPIVYDVHIYNRWLSQSQEDIAARFAALRTQDIAVMIGEIGPSNAGQLHDPFPAIEEATAHDIGVLAWIWKCKSNSGDKNALRSPTTDWCQTWEYNDVDNFGWGSGFSQYLETNYVA